MSGPVTRRSAPARRGQHQKPGGAMIRIASALLSLALSALCAAPSPAAENYPNRPIRLIVPFAPGGGSDINARILSDPMSKALGQTIVVDNRPGAGSSIGSDIVAKSPPD